MHRIGALAVATLLQQGVAHAGQATCSNPGVPIGAAASSDLFPGRLSLGLGFGLLPIRDDELVDEGRYEASLTLLEARMSAEYAIRSWLGVGLSLPYRIAAVAVTYRDPDTGEVISPEPTTHARDQTLVGLGDPSLTVHLAREVGAYRLHARVGATVPLGRTEADPVALGNIGQEHEHLQFGTGTVVPFVGVEAQRRVGDATAALWAVTYQSLYDNDHAYRAGDRYSLGATASSELGLRAFTFGLAAEVHAETAETWRGVVPTDEGNEGRVDVLAGASAAWRASRRLAVALDLKLPVYSHVVGSQLDYPIVVGLGVSGSFDVLGSPSYAGLDEASLPTGGGEPLVPVAGKVTVFDLWAEWCPPCRELDAGLAALARRYPDLAIRKLDVVDDETDAWKAFLAPGSFDLPHVKVFDADGELLFERTADPDVLLKEIEDVLRQP